MLYLWSWEVSKVYYNENCLEVLDPALDQHAWGSISSGLLCWGTQ